LRRWGRRRRKGVSLTKKKFREEQTENGSEHLMERKGDEHLLHVSWGRLKGVGR